MKRILITGGCGFIGSSLAMFFKMKYPHYKVYALDNLYRRGSEMNLARMKDEGIFFCHGDIRNREDMKNLPKTDIVIDAAAEPSVLAGTGSTVDYVINTNLVGTLNTLNYAKENSADIIFISTSRIYPSGLINSINYNETKSRFEIAKSQTIKGVTKRGINESFPLDGPRSIYGASKLASELFVEEFNNLYGIKTVVNRCGNISGPWQMGKIDQGVIALWVARHFWVKELKYIGFNGEGKQIRDVLHIKDLITLIDYQCHHLSNVDGQIFNIGGGLANSVSLFELTRFCQDITRKQINLGRISKTREADIRMYVTDNSKINSLIGWKPEISINEIIEDVFYWIKTNDRQLKSILS